jgi:hypothetical protein
MKTKCTRTLASVMRRSIAPALLVVCVARLATAQPEPDSIVSPEPVDTSRLTPRQAELLEDFSSAPEALQVGVFEIDSRPFLRDDVVRVALPREWEFEAEFERTDSQPAGEVLLWFGEDLDRLSTAAVAVRGPQITGVLESMERIFSFRPFGGPLHAVIEWDAAAFPSEEEPAMEGAFPEFPHGVPRPTPLSQATPKVEPAGTPTPDPTAVPPGTLKPVVSLLVVYTVKAKLNYAIPPDSIQDMITLTVANANKALYQSKIALRLRLTDAVLVADYDEDDKNCLTMDDELTFGQAGLSEAHHLRDLYAADVVVLIFDSNNCAGMSHAILADESSAFSVVKHSLALPNKTLAHEVGHLLGGRHDMASDPKKHPFEQAHGLCNSPHWYTIMATPSKCKQGSMKRIPHFSNPDVNFPPQSIFAGSHTGQLPYCDVASVFNWTGAWVASFRTPARVAVSPSSIELDEGDQTTLALTVLRDGSGVDSAAIRVTSSDSGIATVSHASTTDSTGSAEATINGISPGSAVINVLGEGGTAEVPLHVQEVPAASLALAIAAGLAVFGLLRRRETSIHPE